jgi:hypothetical protein
MESSPPAVIDGEAAGGMNAPRARKYRVTVVGPEERRGAQEGHFEHALPVAQAARTLSTLCALAGYSQALDRKDSGSGLTGHVNESGCRRTVPSWTGPERLR